MMITFPYFVITQVPSVYQESSDALQDEAHSNQVSFSMGVG
jgi:hypothetical protein